jgi:hypothetical protein
MELHQRIEKNLKKNQSQLRPKSKNSNFHISNRADYFSTVGIVEV